MVFLAGNKSGQSYVGRAKVEGGKCIQSLITLVLDRDTALLLFIEHTADKVAGLLQPLLTGADTAQVGCR